MNYYNEFDPYAAQWIKNLIAAGEIPDGKVDTRSITEVTPGDVKGFTQQHYFCGVAGWPLALRLAGWPEDRPVITGSAPCQPFSAAGKKKGQKDERHLWPHMFRLVRESGIDVVFGEQVAAAIKLVWLDGVFADLEGAGYACGAQVLGAHSVGAPHIRQRIFFVAERVEHRTGDGRLEWWSASGERGVDRGRGNGSVADASVPELRRESPAREQQADQQDDGVGGLALPNERRRRGRRDGDPAGSGGKVQAPGRGDVGGMADAEYYGGSRRFPVRSAESSGEKSEGAPTEFGRRSDSRGLADSDGSKPGKRRGDAGEVRGVSQAQCEPEHGAAVLGRGGADGWNPWSDFSVIACTDGKSRRTGAGIPVLAHRLPRSLAALGPRLAALAELAGLSKGNLKAAKSHRLTVLKGAGNAIVPPLAAEFVRAFLDARERMAALEDLL